MGKPDASETASFPCGAVVGFKILRKCGQKADTSTDIQKCTPSLAVTLQLVHAHDKHRCYVGEKTSGQGSEGEGRGGREGSGTECRSFKEHKSWLSQRRVTIIKPCVRGNEMQNPHQWAANELKAQDRLHTQPHSHTHTIARARARGCLL